MSFDNLVVDDHRINLPCEEASDVYRNVFTNVTGNAVNYDTQIRVSDRSAVLGVTREDSLGCNSVPFTCDGGTGRVHVADALNTGAGNMTSVRVHTGLRCDFDGQNGVDPNDAPDFINVLFGVETDCVKLFIADMDGNGLRSRPARPSRNQNAFDVRLSWV